MTCHDCYSKTSANYLHCSSAATDRIRCSMGEWKQRNQFSNKALSTYDYMAQTGRATIKDSLITCREHTSSGQRTELLCQGPCGRVRSANDFSKASKRNKKLVSILIVHSLNSGLLTGHFPLVVQGLHRLADSRVG